MTISNLIKGNYNVFKLTLGVASNKVLLAITETPDDKDSVGKARQNTLTPSDTAFKYQLVFG